MNSNLCNCPSCGQRTLILTKKNDAPSHAWCVNPYCRLSIPKTFFGREISLQEAQMLITKGSTNMLDGFRSVRNPRNHFSSCLMVDKAQHRVTFDKTQNDLYR